MIAKPFPAMDANELLPMQTRQPKTGVYDMNAVVLGIM
jgi:hypothetical protein